MRGPRPLRALWVTSCRRRKLPALWVMEALWRVLPWPESWGHTRDFSEAPLDQDGDSTWLVGLRSPDRAVPAHMDVRAGGLGDPSFPECPRPAPPRDGDSWMCLRRGSAEQGGGPSWPRTRTSTQLRAWPRRGLETLEQAENAAFPHAGLVTQPPSP